MSLLMRKVFFWPACWQDLLENANKIEVVTQLGLTAEHGMQSRDLHYSNKLDSCLGFEWNKCNAGTLALRHKTIHISYII